MTLPELCKQLHVDLPGARTAPGVIVSWLEDKRTWYAAIHVFAGNNRVVFTSTYGESFDKAIEALVWKYRERLAVPQGE
jgi:hypothetical protein